MGPRGTSFWDHPIYIYVFEWNIWSHAQVWNVWDFPVFGWFVVCTAPFVNRSEQKNVPAISQTSVFQCMMNRAQAIYYNYQNKVKLGALCDAYVSINSRDTNKRLNRLKHCANQWKLRKFQPPIEATLHKIPRSWEDFSYLRSREPRSGTLRWRTYNIKSDKQCTVSCTKHVNM